MTHESHPPTQPPECLTQSRASRYKGGTIVDERVWTVDAHLARIADPDGYRPCDCRRCGCTTLHVHDYPERKPVGLAGVPVLKLVRYICVRCGATWRIVPAFLARHLWSVWRRVETATRYDELPREPEVPASTWRRWRSRLSASAKQLVVLFASRAAQAVRGVCLLVGGEATRRTLVDAYAATFDAPDGVRLASVGALADRLERGIRLM
ncbi:MAG: hypothetical protein ACOC1F_13600 [Myxococcota bacterium]